MARPVLPDLGAEWVRRASRRGLGVVRAIELDGPFDAVGTRRGRRILAMWSPPQGRCDTIPGLSQTGGTGSSVRAVLAVDDRKSADGVRSATLTKDQDRQQFIFTRPDGPLSPEAGADPFVLSAALPAMQGGYDLHVEGQVSEVLLRNLADWQAAWVCWRRDRYRMAEITADEVRMEHPDPFGPAVSAFSGGIDSTFTAYQHTFRATRAALPLQAALLVHGADIPTDDVATFGRVRDRAEQMLAGTGIEVLTVTTNFRDTFADWEHGHGAAIAACLALFQNTYSHGLIGSTEHVGNLVLPWGSNPVTDHLMSTGRMAFRHDGGGHSRTERVAAIAGWTQAVDLLRVCWEGDQLDRNCGRCNKCVRTILSFRAAGAPLPACFEADVTDSQIRALRFSPIQQAEASSILDYAAARSLAEPWVRALRSAVRRTVWRDRVSTIRGSLRG
jgi:hypothetical protein